MRKRQVNELQKALESFGRCGKRLCAERLESKAPQLLVELFGEQAIGDPTERQVAAQRVEGALRRIIAAIDDPIDRRIAEVVLASEPEFFDQRVEDRRAYVSTHDHGFTPQQFKDRRPVVVADITASLRRALGIRGMNKLDLLSPEARKAARQLYWYLQETLLYVESFDHVCRVIEGLKVDGEYLLKARDVASSRTVHSDSALWALAHCFEYLRTLQRDETGRDFLRQHLPLSWWRSELNTPFTDYETAEIRTILAHVEVDEAYPLVEAVLRGPHGESAHARWIQLLSAPPPARVEPDSLEATSYGEYRERLIVALIELVTILERVFPEETRPPAEVSVASDVIVWNLILWGPLDLGLSFDDDEGHEVFQAVKAALQNGPALWTARHVFQDLEEGS